MLGVTRRARSGMLGIASLLALSGATRPKPVAARAQEAERGLQRPPEPTPKAEDPAPLAVTSKANSALMLSIPVGDYLPFYKENGRARSLIVPAFKIAANPVTRQEYLAFVRDNPRWRRSRVERLFAESSYLHDWRDDLSFGDSPAARAVTGVAWFAARAYCASVGQRLPSTVEWERALKVVGPIFVDSTGVDRGENVTASLWEWTADFNSLPLADSDPAESVASLFCGAGARATDARDYAAFLRYSFRSSLKAAFALKNLGFRCAESGS